MTATQGTLRAQGTGIHLPAYKKCVSALPHQFCSSQLRTPQVFSNCQFFIFIEGWRCGSAVENDKGMIESKWSAGEAERRDHMGSLLERER